MEANVLKNIGSLVKGDILDYDKDKEYFYLDKIEEFKDKGISRNKKICVTLKKWFVEENPEYFEIVDEHGNVMVSERTTDLMDKLDKKEDKVTKEECLTQNQKCGECEPKIEDKKEEEVKKEIEYRYVPIFYRRPSLIDNMNRWPEINYWLW